MNALVATTLAAAAGFSGLAAAADPKVLSLDFAKDSSTATQTKRGLARRAGTQNSAITSDGSLYYINITVGTPAQKLAVYVDSGSADLWLPASGGGSDFCASTKYGCGGLGGFDPSKSSSFKALQNMGDFEIQYGDGTQIEGEYFTDNVAIGNAKLTNVTMAVALQGSTQYPVNGIMGVGYVTNEAPTEEEEETGELNPYPNIITMLKDEGIINTLAYSIYMNDLQSGKGTILFGGVDKAKYTGDLIVVPIQPDPAYAAYSSQGNGASGSGDGDPFSSGGGSTSSSDDDSFIDAFYVSLTGVGFSGSSNTNYDLGMDSAPVLLDSGTSIIYLPDAVAEQIYDDFGAKIDENYGPVIPCNSAKDGSFTFNFGSGGPMIKVPVSQIVFPFTAAELQGYSAPTFSDGSEACQFGITGAGDSSSSSDDSETPFILGDTFMSSAYVVFDMTNNEIGLAQGNPNATSSNIIEISSTIPADSTVSSVTGAASITATGTTIHRTTRALSATASNFGLDQTLAVTLGNGTPTPTSTHKSSAAGLSASTSVQFSSVIAATLAVIFGLTSGGAILSWM